MRPNINCTCVETYGIFSCVVQSIDGKFHIFFFAKCESDAYVWSDSFFHRTSSRDTFHRIISQLVGQRLPHRDSLHTLSPCHRNNFYSSLLVCMFRHRLYFCFCLFSIQTVVLFTFTFTDSHPNQTTVFRYYHVILVVFSSLKFNCFSFRMLLGSLHSSKLSLNLSNSRRMC